MLFKYPEEEVVVKGRSWKGSEFAVTIEKGVDLKPILSAEKLS